MKTFLKIMLLVVFSCCVTTCDIENSLDCTQTAGELTEKIVDLAPFTKVVVYQRTRLVIKQGPVQQVRIATGANLMNEVLTSVVDGQLIIKNENGCNLIRDYGVTTVYITSPNLTEIRTSTGEDIRSDGTLTYNDLTLLSEDTAQEDEFNTDGDFRLSLNVQNLTIVSNNLSNFYLDGIAQNADFTFLDGDGTIKALDLEIQNAQIFHRGTNLWQLDVQQSITGIISGYGNVALKQRPVNVNVQELWRGRLVYLP
jgi:hypothetical protein